MATTPSESSPTRRSQRSIRSRAESSAELSAARTADVCGSDTSRWKAPAGRSCSLAGASGESPAAPHDSATAIALSGDGSRERKELMATQATTATFESEVLRCDGKVIVDFWAEWCGPCDAVFPVLDRIADEHQVKLVKVNIDEKRDLAQRYGVASIP